jgi:hypothetical protein
MVSVQRAFDRIGKANASWLENARPLFWLSFAIGIVVGIGSGLGALLGDDTVYIAGRHLHGPEGALAGIIGGVAVAAILAPTLATAFYAWGRLKFVLLSLFRRLRP